MKTSVTAPPDICQAGRHARRCLLPALMLFLGIAMPGAGVAQTSAPAAASADERGLFPEPAAIGRAIEAGTRVATSSDGGDVKNGLYPELGNMITGAGWISGGPGYRHWLLDDRAFVDVSAAVSWRAYKMAQARLELPTLAHSRITAGAQIRWQDLTQVSYFGDGPASVETNRSEYRLRSANLVGYSKYRPTRWLSVDGRLGWLTRPDIAEPAGTFKRGNPATADVFGSDPVFQLVDQPNYLHGGASITSDTRDHRSHPTRGAVYKAALVRYADRDARAFGFDRYEVEAAQFIPVAAAHTVVAVHGWLVGTHTGPGQVVPFYLLPSLGGANTLRGYADYRFHDRSLVLLSAEARIALFVHVDTALFVDAGNVAPRVGDLNLDRRSYGIGLRVHARRATVARVDVARGHEGWRVLFRTNDPFQLGRLSRHIAAVPFVP